MTGRRIVHVADVYAPRHGGIEAQVHGLAVQQAAAGDEVHVITATVGLSGERGGTVHQDDGVYVHRVGHRNPFGVPVDPVAGALLRQALGNLSPDVVHAHAGVLPLLAFDAARLAVDRGVPTVLTVYDLPHHVVGRLRGLGSRTGRLALTAVSTVAAAQAGQALGADVEVLSPGLDLSAWVPASLAPERSGEHGPLRLVGRARPGPRHRCVPLLRVVAAAARRLPPDRLRLRMIASGGAARLVDSTAADLGLAHAVETVTRLEPGQVRAEYGRAEVFLAAERSSAFGRSVLEARVAGLVVLGWRGTGLSDFLVDGTDSVLVDDDDQMVEAIVQLARDVGLLTWMRARNRTTRPDAFDWSVVLPATQAQYERAAWLART